MIDRPTILQVLPRLVTGGVERGTVEVAKAIQDRGWNAVVVSAGGPMVGDVEAVGAIHRTLPVDSKNPWQMMKNRDLLQAIIAEHHVCIVHARSRAPAWSAYYAAKRSSVPFMTTFHNAYGAGNFLKRRYNSVMARGERVVAISHYVAKHVQDVYGVSNDRLRIIPRGVDITSFDRMAVDIERIIALRQTWQVSEGTPVIMLPARLTAWKGHKVLVGALAKLKEMGVGKDAVTLLVGGGDDDAYRHSLMEQITAHELTHSVRMVDTCRDMPAALCLADIVVVPSTRPEGFGRVIVEAAAMGCPVIASDHGGASETVLHGRTGWLVPVGDDVALAQALRDALGQSPHARAAMAAAAISHVRASFTTQRMTDSTLAVYEDIMQHMDSV